MLKEIKNLNMGVFYKVSSKQSLKERNELFKEVGVPALKKMDFHKSPFSGAWNGEFDKSNKAFFYQFCRISQNRFLEILDVSVISGDNRINFHICIFEIFPEIEAIKDLNGFDGIPFSMTVENKSKYMRLRSDDYKGPPFFHMLFLPEHKIGCYYTKPGYEAELNKLKKLVQSDMENIDHFVKRWHELHKPNVTDWEGNIIIKATQ